VEDIIFRRVSAEETSAKSGGAPNNDVSSNGAEAGHQPGAASPEVEGFTPPAPEVEDFTPTVSPQIQPKPESELGQDFLESDTYAADPIQEKTTVPGEPTPAFEPPPALPAEASNGQPQPPGTPAIELLSTLNVLQNTGRPSPDASNLDPRKRRKMSHKASDMDDQLFASGDGIGLDDEIAAQLGAQ